MPEHHGGHRTNQAPRIIAGSAKGRRLHTAAGDDTRPTASRVRQTLFDILAPRLPGCRFLDAFAGSGAVGLEALSRGAARVVFVETSRAALAALERNLAALGDLAVASEVFRQDARVALEALAAQGRRFDVVYLDPPYASDLYQPALERITATGLLAEGGVVVAEHFHKRPLPETIGALVTTRCVTIGDHRLSFYAAATAAAAS